jgi:hypothetical protein
METIMMKREGKYDTKRMAEMKAEFIAVNMDFYPKVFKALGVPDFSVQLPLFAFGGKKAYVTYDSEEETINLLTEEGYHIDIELFELCEEALSDLIMSQMTVFNMMMSKTLMHNREN